MLRVLGLYLIVRAIETVFAQYIISVRQDKVFLYGNVASGLISVLTCIILVKRYSAIGAALSVFVGLASAMICVCQGFGDSPDAFTFRLISLVT